MPTATERIPVLVTTVDKSRIAQKAKSFGFPSISEFARTAMSRFRKDELEEEAAFEALLKKAQEGTREVEKAIDRTLAHCDASNTRMAHLANWMKDKEYA